MKEPAIEVNNAFVSLAASVSRLRRAQIGLQKRIYGNCNYENSFTVTQEGKDARVWTVRTWSSLRHCLAEFSEVSGQPIENVNQYPADDPWLYVYDLFVPREIRRQGIGSRLLDCVSRHANEHESHMVLNISRPNKKLHEFYIKNGFQQISATIYFKRHARDKHN